MTIIRNRVIYKNTLDYRVAGPVVDLNFGLVEIDWQASPTPLITLQIIDVEGSVQLEHKVESAELRVQQADRPGKGVTE